MVKIKKQTFRLGKIKDKNSPACKGYILKNT